MKKDSLEKIARAKAIQRTKMPPKIGILALDQATKCGVAYQTPTMTKPVVLNWDLTKKTHESAGIKWLRFERLVEELVDTHNIKVICYELPGGQHTSPIIHSAKLIAIVERLAATKGIEYVETSSGTVKKFATGKGNAKKPEMIAAAQEKLGYEGNDDNEADALWMLQYVKSQFQ